MQDLKALRLHRNSLKEISEAREFKTTEARHRLSKINHVLTWCQEMGQTPNAEIVNELTEVQNLINDAKLAETKALFAYRKAEVELEIAEKKNRQEEKLLKRIADSDIIVTEGIGYLRIKYDEQREEVEFEVLGPFNDMPGATPIPLRIGNVTNIRDTIAVLQTIATKMEADEDRDLIYPYSRG